MKHGVILLDMDEVLVDFIGGVCDLWGVSRADLERNRNRGEWSIEPALCRLLKRDINNRVFWEKIGIYGEHFWAELKPLPWYKELIELVNSTRYDWHIVTGPSACNTSYNGKVRWLKRMFGATFDRFAITPHKELFAKPGATLIDDRKENCFAFSRHGGESIIFPSHGNNLAHTAHDPLAYLRLQPLFQKAS